MRHLQLKYMLMNRDARQPINQNIDNFDVAVSAILGIIPIYPCPVSMQ